MQGHIKPPKLSEGPLSQTPPTCAPTLNSAGYRPSSACAGAGTGVVGGVGRRAGSKPRPQKVCAHLGAGYSQKLQQRGRQNAQRPLPLLERGFCSAR